MKKYFQFIKENWAPRKETELCNLNGEIMSKEFGVNYNSPNNIYAILGGPLNAVLNEKSRNLIIKTLNELKGKKVFFTNTKDGKNIKKERVMTEAYWKKEGRNWNLYLVGTKKDYQVNLYGDIGYYDDGEGPAIKGLDNIEEDDWDIKISYF